MSDAIKLGVIGCGAIVAAVHLRALARIPSIRIVALAEPDERRRRDASARFPGASAGTDWRELVHDARVDAVLIGLPTGLHAECAIAAFQAGKHVYLEKPVAASLDDAGRVVEAWRASGHVGMVGFNYRYSPLYVSLKRAIAAGRVGRVVAVRSVFSTTVAQVPAWKRSRQTGGGVLLDLGSHHADLIPYLLDSKVHSVVSAIQSVSSQDDTAAVAMTLANGVISQSLFSLAAVEEDRIEVYGTAGKLFVDRYASSALQYSPALRSTGLVRGALRALWPARNIPAKVRKVLARGYEPSYARAFSIFADAVRGNVIASPDLNDGYRSLAIVDAAERSAASGRVIEIVPRGEPSRAIVDPEAS